MEKRLNLGEHRIIAGFHKSQTNAHGPKFTKLKSTVRLVQLGKPYGIEKRTLWGLRLWFYRKDGSGFHFDISYWNGKQRGWELQNET